jgi:DNA-binding response OmpR family regulator
MNDEETGSDGSLAGPMVLVIDDDAAIRQLVEFGLQMNGFRVISAADGREGLERFAAERPAWVLLDVSMPGMHGSEVLASLLRAIPKPEVVIMTGHLGERSRFPGAREVLEKPFSFEALLRVLRA